MKVAGVILTAYFVLLIFWLLNHFHRQNVKYEQEYREGKRPRWE